MVKKGIVILIVLVFCIVLTNYYFMNSYSIINFENTGVVERVIDGDTIVVGNKSVRLLGINTPEKGEEYYSEAKEFLEEMVLGKEVELKKGKEDLDKYNRQLRYVFLDKDNINLRLIENGFANPYFLSGADKYSEEFYRAWGNCIINNLNLCKKSTNKCSGCIVLKDFDKKGKVVLENKCSFECDLKNWVVKAEGRDKIEIYEKIKGFGLLGLEFEDIWNDKDSFYLRDEKGDLVLWYSY